MHHEDKEYSTDFINSIESTHFETSGLQGSKSRPGGTISNSLSSFIFYLSILFFIIGFNFSDVMVGGWYQQFMPNIGGRIITDITFTDSLNGYAITSRLQDTSFILQTTNSGNNWFYSYSDSGATFNAIQFINPNTGFVAGRINKSNAFKFVKTTNAGTNWFYINAPFDNGTRDIYAISEDTIWIASDNPLNTGVYRTTNGGASWQNQLFLGNQNPNHVYFYNGRLGFVGKDNLYLRRTTDGGSNWNVISGAGGFLDMHFADSLTGWKTSFQKTSDGGLTWSNQILPQGGNILISQIVKFDNIGNDTIWGVGGTVFWPGFGNRGMVYRTTNSGNNWLFQVPDSNINIFQYQHIEFAKPLIGWGYTGSSGVHTTAGGDPVWLTPVQQTSTDIPKEYKLLQNYPNPFNPITNIGFRVSDFGLITLKIFDITGKETAVLINEELRPGEYKTEWNAYGYTSGIYFYSLMIDGKILETKKMILIK